MKLGIYFYIYNILNLKVICIFYILDLQKLLEKIRFYSTKFLKYNQQKIAKVKIKSKIN